MMARYAKKSKVYSLEYGVYVNGAVITQHCEIRALHAGGAIKNAVDCIKFMYSTSNVSFIKVIGERNEQGTE